MGTSSGTSANHDPRVDQLLNGLHPNLRHNMELLPRPFIVEFDGMPSSGKTTIIRELDTYFRHNGWRVFSPQECAQAMRHIPRTALAEYNIRNALYTIQMIMDAAWTHAYDLLLLDRGIFDCSIWVEYLHRHDWIGANEGSALNLFYLLPFFTDKIDCALVVVCDTDVAFKRKQATQISIPKGLPILILCNASVSSLMKYMSDIAGHIPS